MQKCKNLLRGTICSALVICFSSQISAYELTLVVRGIPKSSIIISDKPTKAAQLAAFEIQEHVKMITGAILPIVDENTEVSNGIKIFVGESKNSGAPNNFKEQEYAVEFKPDAIIIAGRDKQDFGKLNYWYAGTPRIKGAYDYLSWPDLFDQKGTLNAAYDFLEKYCGVRWFDQSEFGTDVPHKKTLRITAKDIRRTPTFSYLGNGRIKANMEMYDRGASLWTIQWDKSTPKYQEWLDLIYEKGRKLPVCKHPHRWLAYERSHVYAFLLRRKMGGEPYKTNHSFYGWYDRFWKKNPKHPELFEGYHPDWFAQGYPDAKVPPQLCYSNPQVVKQCLKDARSFFALPEEERGASSLGTDKMFPVVPMDNTDYCKCPRCMKLGPAHRVQPQYSSNDHSVRVWSFVNEIAKGLKKYNPDKWVSALAYSSYAYRPKGIKIEDNIIVQMCLFPHAAADNPEMLKTDDIILKQWADGRPLYLWLYTRLVTGYKPTVPMFPKPMANLYATLLRKYEKAGVKGIFFDGLPQEADSYFLLKLAEDPSQDPNKIVDDYFLRMYGPKAGNTLKKFYRLTESIFTNPRNHPTGVKGPELYYGILGTGPRMKKLGELVDQAEQELAGAPELWQKRFAMFKFGTWEYMKEGRRQYEKNKVVKASKPMGILCPLVIGGYAGGDLSKIDWRDSQTFGGYNGWIKDSGDISLRHITANMMHDDKYLYIKFAEKDIDRIPGVGDAWEILMRDVNTNGIYSITISPAGDIKGKVILSGGAPQDWNGHAAKALSNISKKTWDVNIALPIKKELLDKYGRLYINCRRKDATGEDSPVLVATGNKYFTADVGATISFDKPLLGNRIMPPDRDLVLDWQLSGTDKDIKDYSRHGNDGVIMGAAQCKGNVIEFNNGGQYIEVPKIAGLNASNFTFTCWLNYPNANSRGGLRIFTWGEFYCMLGVPYQKILFLGKKTDGAVGGAGPFGPELAPGIWHMFTVVFDGKEFSVYENGRKRGGVTLKRSKLRSPDPNSAWQIGGGHKFKPWQTFLGKFSHIQYYRRGLLPEEIMAKYKEELSEYRK